MDTSSNQDECKDEEITLGSKFSTPYSPNTGQLINSNDEMNATQKILEG